jgi:uncharacterized protein
MLTLVFALLAAITVPPKPAGYVTDNAGVLDPSRAKAVNEKLAQFERETSNQVLVYVDHKLPPDTTIEQFANDAFHQWQVGQKGKDNGAALFLFTDDRKMRIEVGYGLEAVLTDAKSKDITSTIIKPRLKASDYNGAVEQGVDAIIAAARVEANKGTGQTVREAKRTRIPVSPAAHDSNAALVPCFVALFFGFGVIVLLAVVLLRRRGGWVSPNPSGTTPTFSDSSTDSSSSSWSSSSSSDFSSSDSSSSSSSGFDGGGGDSGGGGASDSW